MAVLDRAEVVYQDKIEAPHSIKLSSVIGGRNPAHATGWARPCWHGLTPQMRPSSPGPRGGHRYLRDHRTITNPASFPSSLPRCGNVDMP